MLHPPTSTSPSSPTYKHPLCLPIQQLHTTLSVLQHPLSPNQQRLTTTLQTPPSPWTTGTRSPRLAAKPAAAAVSARPSSAAKARSTPPSAPARSSRRRRNTPPATYVYRPTGHGGLSASASSRLTPAHHAITIPCMSTPSPPPHLFLIAFAPTASQPALTPTNRPDPAPRPRRNR